MKTREELRDALADVIREQPETLVPARGVSMGPGLARAEALVVRGIHNTRPRLGSIILYKRDSLWVAHRLIWRGKGGVFMTRGDANPVFDFPPATEKELLGVVTGVIIDGKPKIFGWPDRLLGAWRWLCSAALLVKRTKAKVAATMER